MTTFVNNTYAGEVLDDLLTYTAQENDTYRHGLVHVETGIQFKYVLPSISLGNIIQDNVDTPTASKGEYTIRERYLEPKDFMVYLEFNPRDFEKYWKPFQPDGELIFRELDPKVQAVMLRQLMEEKNEYLGNAIWLSALTDTKYTAPAGGQSLGDKTAMFKYFDGAIARIIDNISDSTLPATEKCIVAGTTVLSNEDAKVAGANVEKALYTMWKKAPAKIRSNKDLTFVISWELWDAYDQYLTDKNTKYVENTDINKLRFKGKRIIPIVGIPEETIVLGVFSNDRKSNLWMAVDYASDQNAVKVSPLQANSEKWFFQMRLKMDVNIVRPGEIVVWTAYTKTA